MNHCSSGSGFQSSLLWVRNKNELSQCWWTVKHRRTSHSRFVTRGCFIPRRRRDDGSLSLVFRGATPCLSLNYRPLNTVYTSLSSARRDFLRSGNFQPKIKKKKYRLRWQKKFNSPKWSMDVIWRLGTEPRHFDQEIWGGNNSDMVVFAVDERRVEVVFLFSSLPPSLSPSVCLSVILQ